MNLYILKVPVTTGFQDKATRADILICEDFEDDTYCTQINDKATFYEVIDDYQVIGHVDLDMDKLSESSYSDSQIVSAIRIPIDQIELDNMTTDSEWNDFVSQF